MEIISTEMLRPARVFRFVLTPDLTGVDFPMRPDLSFSAFWLLVVISKHAGINLSNAVNIARMDYSWAWTVLQNLRRQKLVTVVSTERDLCLTATADGESLVREFVNQLTVFLEKE